MFIWTISDIIGIAFFAVTVSVFTLVSLVDYLRTKLKRRGSYS